MQAFVKLRAEVPPIVDLLLRQDGSGSRVHQLEPSFGCHSSEKFTHTTSHLNARATPPARLNALACRTAPIPSIVPYQKHRMDGTDRSICFFFGSFMTHLYRVLTSARSFVFIRNVPSPTGSRSLLAQRAILIPPDGLLHFSSCHSGLNPAFQCFHACLMADAFDPTLLVHPSVVDLKSEPIAVYPRHSSL